MFRTWIFVRGALVGCLCLASLAFPADPAGRPAPAPPPLPPAPPARPTPAGPVSARPPASAAPVSSNSVAPVRATPARAGTVNQRFSPGAVSIPLSDPSYIPGLSPAIVVGPLVPLAPQQPGTPFPYAAPRPARVQETVFAYDALIKETTLKAGETSAYFTFHLTNTSPEAVTINAVRTSCGCAVAKLPSVPWRIEPRASGAFDVVVDVRGSRGVATKTVTIDSTAGYRYLTVRVAMPESASPMAAADRARNLQVALADRQAVFKGDCAACHLQPVIAQHGQALFKSACGICHEAERRAAAVPGLRALNKPTDRAYWSGWIAKGKPGGLMPAWAIDEGGPLTGRQIESLLDYLTGPFRNEPAGAPQPPAVPTRSSTPPAVR